MKPASFRSGLVAAMTASSFILASCSTPEVAAPPPPPAPVRVAPSISLSHGVVQAAAAYQGYMRQATALKAGFTAGDQIASSLQTGESYEPKQLARGMVAYAAILALQEPSFVTGVRTYAMDPVQRADMINKIFADPAYAAQLPGAQAAAGLIVAKLNADGEALHRTGSSIKQSAYDIQREGWSKESVADREGRLARAKMLSTQPAMASTEDAATLMQAAVTGQGLGLTGGSTQPPYTQAVIRGLAIAALAVLGAGGDDNARNVDALMDEGTGPYCLSMAKLNLYQCLAVSKPHFEDVFCLGQHVLMDTGRCVQKVVGTAPYEQTTVDRMTAAREAKGQTGPIGQSYDSLQKKPAKKPAKAPAKKKK